MTRQEGRGKKKEGRKEGRKAGFFIFLFSKTQNKLLI
jgi:hypothetical protein